MQSIAAEVQYWDQNLPVLNTCKKVSTVSNGKGFVVVEVLQNILRSLESQKTVTKILFEKKASCH